MEIVSSIILYGFAVAVLGMVGKLIYEVQQSKKKRSKENETEFELKDKFQTLAGIKPYDSQRGTNDLVDIMLKAEEIQKEGFPEQDPSIPVYSAPLTTIQPKTVDSDPLGEIPISRVSIEAKKKMADIAMGDIKRQVEENAANIPEPVDYNEVDMNDQRLGIEIVKPKKKATKKTTKAAPKKNATKNSNKTK